MKKRLLALVLVLTLAGSLAAALADGIGTAVTSPSGTHGGPVNPEPMTMYVKTDNGRGLNVRSAPVEGSNIIGLVPNGSMVKVIRFENNGFACIVWNGYGSVNGEAYVVSQFLVWNAPAPVTPVPVTPVPVTTPPPVYPGLITPVPPSGSMDVLNAEFRTARQVTPFSIVVRPTSTKGWVNLRWAPSTEAEVIITCNNGDLLTVIAETQSWYQVQDPYTGVTGFIMKLYTARKY